MTRLLTGGARDGFARLALLAPSLALLAGLTLVPIGNLIVASFHEISWSQGQATWTWVGSAHYRALADDGLLGAGVVNTAVFAAIGVAIQMALGLFLAVLTTGVVRGELVYRTVFLLPILVPGIVIGAMWKLIYNPDFGPLNAAAAFFGIAGPDWLGDPNLALGALIAVNVWHWTPFCYLLLLAGLQALPQDAIEAARVDGATAWQEFRYVTLPMMLPAIAVTFVFRFITAVKVFDEVYLLTGGGPGTATEVVSFSIYRRFFTEDRIGYGSALSVAILFAMALVIVLALGALQRRGSGA
ncbi:MAG: sugar ABC transporter permease [Tagaea sp.]|nr:sugar ABC transporter permease [Tagaea sp.]